MHKKWIAGILSAGLLLQTVGAVSFTDVGEEYAWAQEAISALAEKNIILGVSEGVYAPEDSVTQEQLAALTVRAFEIDGEVPETPSFSDVSADRWSFRAVELAKEFFAENAGTFAPEQDATRLTVASVLMKTLDQQMSQAPYQTATVAFSDVAHLSAEEQEWIRKAAATGIIHGYPDGTFGSEKRVTRAEVAVMIERALEQKETVQPIPTEAPEATPSATPTSTPKPSATPDVPSASKSRGEFMVVTGVSTVTDVDGDEAIKVNGYLDGEEVSVSVEKGDITNASGIEKNGTTIHVGDVIAYLKDIKGNVVQCSILFKASAAVHNQNIINPYQDEDMAVEHAYNYFQTAYGLVRRAQGSTLEVVYDDTVELGVSGKSGSYSVGKTANVYLYDASGRNAEVKTADLGDIYADKTVGAVPQSDEGNYVFLRVQDDVATDVLILNGDFS